MYLATYSLRDEGSVTVGGEQASLGRSNAMVKQQGTSFFAALFGEERPVDMLTLLSILVLLLHVSGLLWLLRPVEPTTRAQPLTMEVSMIAIPAPRPSVAPLPAPVPPEIKPPPKKPKPRPMPKKMPPVVQRAPDFAPVEQVAEPPPAQQMAAPQASVATDNEVLAADEPFTEADFRANYAHNPKPIYPPAARSRGLEGKVMLRVRVSAEGLSDHVAVDRSSGHDVLDESAVEAVKKWRFIPAKRGETTVASSVIVPISFALR